MEEKILIHIVDDDEIFQFTAESLIEIELGKIGVIVSSNGEDAINHLITNIDENAALIPNIIFLDINMPRMNGFEFIEAFKKIKDQVPNISIYMVSSSVDPADIEKAKMIEEIKDYIIKPLERKTIRKIYNDYKLQY